MLVYILVLLHLSSVTGFKPLTDATIVAAVEAYPLTGGRSKQHVLDSYGEMSQWDTSQVSIMSHLFADNVNFDEDISGWDVRNVCNMVGKFRGTSAFSFNQELGGWM